MGEMWDKEDKVSFEPFIGISGRRYFDLFSLEWGSGDKIKRMNDDDDTGELIDWKPENAKFRFIIAPKSHEFNEDNAIKELKEAKKKIKKLAKKMNTSRYR